MHQANKGHNVRNKRTLKSRLENLILGRDEILPSCGITGYQEHYKQTVYFSPSVQYDENEYRCDQLPSESKLNVEHC